MIRYVLLSTGQGVAVERYADVVCNELPVKFDGLPEGNILVAFEGKNGSKYSTPNADGICFVPVAILDGDVCVTVRIMEGIVRPSRWDCEYIHCSRHTKDGGVVVWSSDARTAKFVADLKVENEFLRKKLEDLSGEVDSVKERVSDLLDGYDIT